MVDVTGGLFTLVGTLRTTITGTGVAVYADSMVLPGDITCDGLLLILETATGAIRSSGNHTANPTCRIDLIPAEPGLVLEGGALGGDGAIGAYGSVHWKGGSLPAHPTTGAAPLTLFGDTLFLEAPTLSGTIGGYFFRKKDPNRPSNINIRMMHGINKISIAIFLVAVLYLVLKRLF